MKPKVRSILNLVQSKMNEEEDPGNVPFTMKITIKQNVDAVTGKLMDNAVDHTVDFKYGGTKTNDAALNALGEKAVLDAVRETVASIPAADKGKTVKVFACDYSSHLP
jgi:hypothetical protein